MTKTNRSGKSALLTSSQIEEVTISLPSKYSLLAECLYYSAGRVSEISTIRVRSIEFKEGILTIEKSSTKTKETRQIPLPKTTLSKLSEWIQKNSLSADDYIFFTESRNSKCKKGEKCISTQSADAFLRKAFEDNGIAGASTHSFRRSRLTHLHVREKWSLREIMDISGHKSIMALQHYLDTDRKVTFEKYRRLFEKEMV